jgi:hypothetical protein
MADIVVPPGFIEVLIRYTSTVGHRCQNVMGYAITDAWDQTATDTISADIAVPYKAQLSESSQFVGVKVLVGNDGPNPEFESTAGAGPGTESDSVCGPQVQGLLHKSTGLAGRKFRGRCFIPDMHEVNVDDSGGINSGGLGLLNGIANVLDSALGVGALIDHSVILHPAGTDPTPITAMFAENHVATLRRRYKRP